MPPRRKTSRLPSSATLLRPWLIAAGTGLVLGGLLLFLDSGESTSPFFNFGSIENAPEPFEPNEAMITRIETGFRDNFSRHTAAGLTQEQNPGLTPPPASAKGETPESMR